jgi:antitoxin VapB
MALNIKSPEVDRLARELTSATGETLTTAVEVALRERLERTTGNKATRVSRRLHALRDEISRLPVLDDRRPEDILGYDHDGLPA